MAENLQQAVSPELIDGQVAKLVHAQHLLLDAVIERTFDTASGLCLAQRVDDLYSTGEQHREVRQVRPVLIDSHLRQRLVVLQHEPQP